jgi:hypothetical protein
MQKYRADRSFDGFNAGEVVELDPDDEVSARYLRTGYLEPVDEAGQVTGPAPEAAAAEREPAGFALVSTPASSSTPDTVTVESAPADAGTETSGEEAAEDGPSPVQGDGEARPVKRPRRRE